MIATERIQELRKADPRFKNMGMTKKENSNTDIQRVKSSVKVLEESAKKEFGDNINE